MDYDPGASEVNQLNRIKLMLSTARKNLNARPADPQPAARRLTVPAKNPKKAKIVLANFIRMCYDI